ncbi:MAG: type II toxin-antitoxin system RelE/ParE family toxin [Pseudomonadota bacterium]
MQGPLIVIHPEAIAEAQAARAWFSARNPAVGDRFLAEYDRAIACIAESPNRWPEHPRIPGYRWWFRFGRFGYSVVYEILPDMVHVLAVAILAKTATSDSAAEVGASANCHVFALGDCESSFETRRAGRRWCSETMGG